MSSDERTGKSARRVIITVPISRKAESIKKLGVQDQKMYACKKVSMILIGSVGGECGSI